MFKRISNFILTLVFALSGIYALTAGFFIYSGLVESFLYDGIIEGGNSLYHLISWGVSLGAAFLLILINQSKISISISFPAFILYLITLFLYIFHFDSPIKYGIFPAAFISFIALLISFLDIINGRMIKT